LTNGIISSPGANSFVARRSTPRTDPIRTGPIQAVKTTAIEVPTTRRAARAADRAEVRAKRPSTKKTAISIVVMTLTAGLVGTMALPAFALTPNSSDTGSSSTTAAVSAARTTGAQSVAVASSATDVSVSRDDYTTTLPVVKTATTSTVLSATQTTAAVAKRATFAATTAYTGKTAADYLAAPSHPAFSLAAVYQTALQYVGTPYVFGGATPSGFDCSGFVMYVYAQYGISLAHSVPAQSAAGTIISEADAEPGDIVVLNNGSHDGFYAGNGMILDAPKPGGSVSVRPLWTSDVHFVRFGIK
jgi:cell wall-associated NlpC family hydrolase